MQQVVVVGGNDEDMSALLDVLNTPLPSHQPEVPSSDPLQECDPLSTVEYQLNLKTDVLKVRGWHFLLLSHAVK